MPESDVYNVLQLTTMWLPLVVTTRSRHFVLFTADCRLTGDTLLFFLMLFFSHNATASSSFHPQLNFYGEVQEAFF
jgi:hypothetical protein